MCARTEDHTCLCSPLHVCADIRIAFARFPENPRILPRRFPGLVAMLVPRRPSHDRCASASASRSRHAPAYSLRDCTKPRNARCEGLLLSTASAPRTGAAPSTARFLLGKQSVELSARHLQLVRVSVNPGGKGRKFFRRIPALELSAVPACTIQLKVKSILQVGVLSLGDSRRRQDCRNKEHAVPLSQNQVPRQHHGAPDTHRYVDPRQLHMG